MAYDFHPKSFIEQQLTGTSDWVRAEFARLLTILAEHPKAVDGPFGILPLKVTELPQAYTAPFDDGFLTYQVMADHPIIQFLDVFLMEVDPNVGNE